MPIYDNEARGEIDAVVRRVQQTPGTIEGTPPIDRGVPSQRPAQFRNDSGETIPAYGCMQLANGAKYSAGPPVPFFIASKPETTLVTDRFAINGPNPVSSGDHGECYLSGQVKALYNTGTPAAGDSYGPTPGQWYLTKDYPPIFRTAVISDATPNHVYGELHPIGLLRGELKDAMPSTGSVAAGQTATATFLAEDGARITAIEFEVTDVFGRFRGRAWVSGALRGSSFYAEFAPDADEWEIVTMHEHALRISGIAAANVYYDDTEFTLSGTTKIMSPSGALAMEDLTTANLIKNPLGLQFASSDIVHAEWNEKATTPQWEAVDEGRPRPHRITGLASAAVYYNTTEFTLTGTPDIINPIDAISEEVYTATNLIKNPYGLTFPINGTVFAEYNDTDSQWEAVGPNEAVNQQATWLEFTASADFFTGGAISIDARTYLDGQAPAVDITSILNPMNLTGEDNAIGVARINRNVSPPTYTAWHVAPVAENVITEFRVDTSTLKLQTKNRDISIMPRGDESDWDYTHQGDDCP